MKKIFYGLLLIAFLPLVMLVDAIRSKRSWWKKIIYVLVIFIFLGLVWITTAFDTTTYITSLLFTTGLRDNLSEVHVSGTSMLPTIKDGSTVTLHNPKKYGLTRGDMVSFQNTETGGLFYLKRIVGLPGEKLLLKNGQVYVNGKPLFESYTLNSLPTFGNTFLTECEEYTIPQNHFAVFGDNRTVSQDSRVVGFVASDDIEGVIKPTTKPIYTGQGDSVTVEKKTVEPEEFLQILNDKRKKEKLSLLVTHETLNELSKLRAEQINDNFKAWKKDDLVIEQLLDKEGYAFNQVHEYITFGYLDGNDIVNQILESQQEKNSFLSPEFTEVGVGVVNRKVGECTYPVVSVLLSWPSVPTYDASVVASWSEEITATNKILSDLQSWVGYPQKDQKKLRAMITIAAEENQIAKRIYGRMSAREWLTSDDYTDIKRYDGLVKEGDGLMAALFPNVKGISTPITPIRRL